jgi:transcriptional regulator with XRE-family HTH domain
VGHIGELLHAARLKLGFTLREVMARSQIVAKVWGNPSLVVHYGYLGKVEQGKHNPTVDKFFSLTEVYSQSADEMLRAYKSQCGVSLLPDPVGGPNLTQMITGGRLEERALHFLPQNFGATPPPAQTLLLPPSDSIDKHRYIRVVVGSFNHTLSPYYRPGTIFTIDTHRRAIASYKQWTSEFDRPIYLLYTREGYLCAWCELDETSSWLTVVPHICSKAPHKHLRYGREVEVVGRAKNVSIDLDG